MVQDAFTGDHSARLERELAALRTENQRLRNLLKVTHGVEPPAAQPVLVPPDPGLVTMASPDEAKLALYANRFAARTDVYAAYWENLRKGTRGWSPVTRYSLHTHRGSLWDRQPQPLTPKVIEAHLKSDNDFFLGLYPLLPDATCWWLAVDFDGTQAMLDAHAYVKAATSMGIPTGLEISQSGRGAHVWTFFASPVAAADARAMGTVCLHRAMTLRGTMSLGAYDRMFPNQDTVPVTSSSVGNLIAAPLNGQRKKERHTTLFVDMMTWEPYEDQWEFLSRLDRMTPRQVAAAGRQDRIVVGSDVQRVEPAAATVVHPQPAAQIHATLGARLTISDAELSPELSAALRHAATIHNPAFYEAQRARRWTGKIPRFISGYDIAINGDLVMPRGLREQVETLVNQAGSELVIDDERDHGTELDIAFSGELSERQSAAVDAMLAHEDGILQAPTGVGKTVMACAIIAERAVSTLVLINKTALAAQWREQIRHWTGIKPGQLGGGRKKTTGQVDIMLLQTLARHGPEEIRELTSGYGQVIVDECHHVAAASYDNAIASIGSAWFLGLTATPERKDGLEPVTAWQLGPIRHVWRDVLPSEATLVAPYDGPERILVVHETRFRAPADFFLDEPGAITRLGGVLAGDDARNRQIADDIAAALGQGRKCLVLSRRRDHLATLAGLLPGAEALVMSGQTAKKVVEAVRERIREAGPADPLLVMTTVPFGGEGIDAPILDTVFLVGPISYPGLVIQAVGRAMRSYEGKTQVVVHDYVDVEVPVLSAQYGRRRPAYRQTGFSQRK